MCTATSPAARSTTTTSPATDAGRVEDIGEGHIAPLTHNIQRERGFRIDDARVDFYGTCAACLAPEAG